MQKFEHASDHHGKNSSEHLETSAEHAWGVCVLFYLAVIVPLWILFEVIRLLAGW